MIVTGLPQGPVSIGSLDWPADCGAECVFLGRTRAEQHPQYGELLHLEYEMYQPMADQLLRDYARDVVRDFGARAVRIEHAQGRVGLGEASVVIQVATPHRSEAYDACRAILERIKHELPVWKHEIWQRGRTFVQGCCVQHEGDKPR